MKNKLKLIALLLSAVILCPLTACSNNEERLEGADTLPTVSSRQKTETETDSETETAAQTTLPPITSDTTARTGKSTEAPELATRTETESTIIIPSETDSFGSDTAPEIPVSDYISKMFPESGSTEISTAEPVTTTGEQIYEMTVSGTKAPDNNDTDQIFVTETGKSDDFPPYILEKEITRPYSYFKMNSTQRLVYDDIVNAAATFDNEITFPSTVKITVSDLYFIYQTLFSDQIDVFYLDTTIQYLANTNTGYVSKMYIEYTITQKEAAAMLKKTDAAADAIIGKITSSMSEYDIVKLFHDEIIKNCDYSLTAENSSDIYGCLVGREALCQGYAKAFEYLCNKVGIETMIVSGEAGEEPHMWNLVKIDGDWYHIDLTWDDANKSEYPDFVRYDYFCVTDELIYKLRTVYSLTYSYPKATAEKCNYYVHNGYTADSVDEAEQLLMNAIYDASKNKQAAAQILCSSESVYNKASVKLFNATSGTALTLLENVYDKAPNKYNRESLIYNKSNQTYTIKIFLQYLD